MLILDENADDDQRVALLRYHFRVRQVGLDIAAKGMDDADLLRLLQTLPGPTFVTRDLKLYQRSHCHPRYCVAVFEVSKERLAEMARRFLRLDSFDTRRKRMGRVVRAGQAGCRYWTFGHQQERVLSWIARG